MTTQDDFQKAMHDIYKYSPLIGLEGQEMLQRWVRRLAAAGAGGEQEHAVDFARYLAYQLERAQLRFPFSQPPTEEPLPNLKEVLFGAGSSVTSESLNLSHNVSFKTQRERDPTYKDYSLNTSAALTQVAEDITAWDSHGGPPSDWESHIADPKCERNVIANLEELADDANLWLLLTRLSPHTRDRGALLNAVLAEELAEWSARLAAEQTAATTRAGRGWVEEDEEEDWAAKADRRADQWLEVSEACQMLDSEEPRAAEQLLADIDTWLNQQNRQLQAEQFQLQALTEELQGIKRQVVQSQKWRESQFEMQNRVLQAEVAALKQSIADSAKKVQELKGNWAEPSTNRGTPAAKKRLSMSQDSLNASTE